MKLEFYCTEHVSNSCPKPVTGIRHFSPAAVRRRTTRDGTPCKDFRSETYSATNLASVRCTTSSVSSCSPNNNCFSDTKTWPSAWTSALAEAFHDSSSETHMVRLVLVSLA